MERSIQRGICFTKFLIAKDCLTASMTRIGNGFSPPTVIAEAKQHLMDIQVLVKQMEEIQRKDPLPSSNHLQ